MTDPSPTLHILPPLHTWPAPYRKLIAAFVAVSLLGVVVGAIFIEVTTHLTPEGVTAQYRGLSEAQMAQAGEMKFPKSRKELLTTMHNHILGLSVLFVLIAFLYLHTGRAGSLRLAIATEPILTLIVTFGGLWIVRFLWAPFVYVVILSGTLMIASVLWMGYRVLAACLRGTRYGSYYRRI